MSTVISTIILKHLTHQIKTLKIDFQQLQFYNHFYLVPFKFRKRNLMQKAKCKHVPLSLPLRELKSLSKIPKGNFSIKESISEKIRSNLSLELSFNDRVVDGSRVRKKKCLLNI